MAQKHEILSALENSQYWGEKTKRTGDAINGLICPECGHAEAFCFVDRPFSIFCHRNNSCGATTKTLSLFPDIFANIEKKYKPTSSNPLRPAEKFLELRGLPDKTHLAMRKLKYKYVENIRNCGSGGIMFYVGKDPDGNPVWNGRIFNPPKGEGKTHNQGKTKGLVWSNPSFTYDKKEPVYVVEAIIDAISICAMGEQAVAVLASGADPKSINLLQYGKPIFAFDNDKAGCKGLKRWSKAFPDSEAIMLPPKQDYNDFIQNYSSLKEATAKFLWLQSRFKTTANLARAESPEKYVEIFYAANKRVPGLFAFDKKYYWSFAKMVKGESELISYSVSNFILEVEHFRLDIQNKEKPKNQFYIKIIPKRGRPVRCAIEAQELATPSGLTSIFLKRARVVWKGDRFSTNAMIQLITESGAPIIRQLQTVGYDEKSNYYVFPDFAISPTGQKQLPNKNGFFQVDKARCLRPAQYRTLKPAKTKYSPKDIWQMVFDAWGSHGAVAMAWTWAAWWTTQIKEDMGFFPFLSLWGDPATGKSKLARVLNAFQCIDEEGLPLNKVNTSKGETRKMAQFSNLVKALLESTNDGKRRFSMDTILPLYNINPLQTIAMRTMDNQTSEMPFLATLLFVQNENIFITRPQKERAITLKFKKDCQSEASLAAFQTLSAVPPREIASMFPELMQKCRVDIDQKWREAVSDASRSLERAISDTRLRENFAIVLAWHRMVSEKLGINYDLAPHIKKLGAKKQRECELRLETPADHFFNILFDLDDVDEEGAEPTQPYMKESKKKGQIWISLKDAEKKIADSKFTFKINLADLQKSLREHPAFIRNNVTQRLATHLKPRKVWVFDKEKLRHKKYDNYMCIDNSEFTL